MSNTPENAPRGYQIGQAWLPAPPPDPALYLVATPIGNLADITIRALQVLAGADIVACEDTRVTRVLLDATSAGPRLIRALEAGKSVALVSDAGTPLVSDPGFRLVEQAVAAGIRVVPVPGPSAALAALTASGLPSDAFFFAGFLPVKAGARHSRLEALSAIPATLVFYESPRRLDDALAAMADVLGAGRPATVGRELTKTFEEFRRATLGELAAHYREAGAPKGEVVICVAPPGETAAPQAGDVDALLRELGTEMPASKAAAEAARMTGLAKQDLFRRLVELKAADG